MVNEWKDMKYLLNYAKDVVIGFARLNGYKRKVALAKAPSEEEAVTVR